MKTAMTNQAFKTIERRSAIGRGQFPLFSKNACNSSLPAMDFEIASHNAIIFNVKMIYAPFGRIGITTVPYHADSSREESIESAENREALGESGRQQLVDRPIACRIPSRRLSAMADFLLPFSVLSTQ